MASSGHRARTRVRKITAYDDINHDHIEKMLETVNLLRKKPVTRDELVAQMLSGRLRIAKNLWRMSQKVKSSINFKDFPDRRPHTTPMNQSPAKSTASSQDSNKSSGYDTGEIQQDNLDEEDDVVMHATQH